MTDSVQDTADQRLQSALDERGARDPREFYRGQLRELREANPQGYDDAVRYYKDTLIPSIGSEGADPLVAWTEYGRQLATLRDEKRMKAILVALPAELSSAQRATYDWLVSGRLKLQENA